MPILTIISLIFWGKLFSTVLMGFFTIFYYLLLIQNTSYEKIIEMQQIKIPETQAEAMAILQQKNIKGVFNGLSESVQRQKKN